MDYPKTMSQEKLDQWIEAISPGGSHYDRKGKNSMHNRSGEMCCLGVLADLNGANWFKEGSSYVCQHQSEDEEFLASNFMGLSKSSQLALAKVNDCNETFDPVVRCIRDMVENGGIKVNG